MTHQVNLEGIIGPMDWDKSGNPTQMALFLKDEKQHPIAMNTDEGQSTLEMHGKRVLITGSFQDTDYQKQLIIDDIEELDFSS